MDILEKIKQAKLVGRGGAAFPVWQKWLSVKNASGKEKYVVCNAAEGEPGVEKDGYILENYPEQVIDGIKIAIDFLLVKKAYIYINNKYYKKFCRKLEKIIGNAPIVLFIKPLDSGYIGGEESAILNAIEGLRVEPRLKPPYPTTSGLWQSPTLINNVETFYNVSLVEHNQYKNERFYTISGDCLKSGVYKLPQSYTIEKILKQTGNFPKFPFFVQVGGNMSGQVLNSKQIKRPATGAGSITIFSLEKYGFKKLIKGWLEFYKDESCGKCTPCREGVFRLSEAAMADKVDWLLFKDLLENLSNTSFCALGGSVPIPIVSFARNVLPIMPESRLEFKNVNKKNIHDILK